MSNRTKLVHTFHANTTSSNIGKELSITQEMTTLNVDISGINAGLNVEFEAKIDNNTTWKNIQGVSLGTMSLASSALSSNLIYQFDLTGLYKIRLNVTSITSGDVTIIGRVVG